MCSQIGDALSSAGEVLARDGARTKDSVTRETLTANSVLNLVVAKYRSKNYSNSSKVQWLRLEQVLEAARVPVGAGSWSAVTLERASPWIRRSTHMRVGDNKALQIRNLRVSGSHRAPYYSEIGQACD